MLTGRPDVCCADRIVMARGCAWVGVSRETRGWGMGKSDLLGLACEISLRLAF